MASGTIDFEKYPKYLLNKHGTVIQNILSNAEAVFGMGTSEQTAIAIKQEIKGGENLKNSSGNSALFTDAITISEESGIVRLDLPGEHKDVNLAIAEFATIDHIKDLFTNTETGDDFDVEELPVLDTPDIQFNINATEALVISPEQAGTVDYLFKIDSSELVEAAEVTTAYEYATPQNAVCPVPSNTNNLQKSIVHNITVQAIGDELLATTSPRVEGIDYPQLQKVQLAAPIIELESITDLVPTYKISCLDTITLASATINYNISYKVFDYNLARLAESIISVEPGETIMQELALGSSIESYATGSTLLDNTKYFIENAVSSNKYSFYKVLPYSPNLTNKINSVSGIVYLDPKQYRDAGVASHYQKYDGAGDPIGDSVPLSIQYICQVKPKDAVDFDEPICLDAFDAEGDIVIGLHLNAGDTFRVKARVTEFYQDSDFSADTVMPNIDEGEDIQIPGTPTIFEYYN